MREQPVLYDIIQPVVDLAFEFVFGMLKQEFTEQMLPGSGIFAAGGADRFMGV
jgi:hypothetical protein